jgi:hypothetical protein
VVGVVNTGKPMHFQGEQLQGTAQVMQQNSAAAQSHAIIPATLTVILG